MRDSVKIHEQDNSIKIPGDRVPVEKFHFGILRTGLTDNRTSMLFKKCDRQ